MGAGVSQSATCSTPIGQGHVTGSHRLSGALQKSEPDQHEDRRPAPEISNARVVVRNGQQHRQHPPERRRSQGLRGSPASARCARHLLEAPEDERADGTPEGRHLPGL